MPHFIQIRIGGQRTALRLFNRPVLSGAPRTPELIAGRPEFPSRPAAFDDFALTRQKSVDEQAPTAVLKSEIRRVGIGRASVPRIMSTIAGHKRRLVHAMKRPHFLV